jgi:hypothetical protein
MNEKLQNTPLASYMPKRTFLVKNIGTNYLVRGNEPLNDDCTFAYDAINTKLKTLISGFDLTKYKLITISLIDNLPASERPDLESEFVAYGMTRNEFDSTFPYSTNPMSATTWPPYYRKVDVEKQYGTEVCNNKGSIIWYPVQGCSDMNNCALVEPSQYNFSGLVDYIHQMMTEEKETVIYYHCEHGHDRTSALTGGYMLKYMGKTLNDVLTQKPPMGAKAFKHAWEPYYEELVKYYSSTL